MAGLLLGLLLAGCGEPTAPPIRIGISMFPAYELVHLANVKGFFRDAGVEVRVVEFQSLSDCDRALSLGLIDIAAMPVVNVAVTAARGQMTPLPFWVMDYSAGADMLVGRPAVPDGRALAGKRVGVESDSLGFHVLHLALQANGLNSGDITVETFVDQPAGVAAFAAGEIEALVTYFPFVETLRAKHGARTLFDTSMGPGEVLDVLAATPTLAAERTEVLPAVREAMADALEFLAQEPASALAIMAARERMPVAVFESALRTGLHLVGVEEQARFFGPEGPLAKALLHNAEVLRAFGVIEATAPIESLIPRLTTLPAPTP